MRPKPCLRCGLDQGKAKSCLEGFDRHRGGNRTNEELQWHRIPSEQWAAYRYATDRELHDAFQRQLCTIKGHTFTAKSVGMCVICREVNPYEQMIFEATLQAMSTAGCLASTRSTWCDIHGEVMIGRVCPTINAYIESTYSVFERYTS